jgi:hypothetical protein
MTCQHCQAPFAVKTRFLAKTCGCDEEERFISFEDWYEILFNYQFSFQDGSSI